MYSEIDQFSSFLRGMSDSRDNHQQDFLVKQQEEGKTLRLENPESCQEIESESVQENKEEILERDTDHCEEKREANNAENEPENSVPGDDDDGFKTPTSSDHKIPAITQCPPPPRKIRTQPSKSKRKASTDRARRNLRFDELVEVGSIFLPARDEDELGSKRSRKVTESG
ncbi:uncharacterized protein [Primulina huaijiensis]|uniref:uncharacterized protein n=1 Tax=Primulina huaijiensis TaxID=1492673 RepID=UPI003CC75573